MPRRMRRNLKGQWTNEATRHRWIMQTAMIRSLSVLFVCVAGVLCQDKPVLLVKVQPGCPGSVLLPCIANGASSIFFQVFEHNGVRFSTLTSARIDNDLDYDETQINGSYTLHVVHTANHNGSLYRCTGFLNGVRVYSNEERLLIAGCIEPSAVSMRTILTPPLTAHPSSTVPDMNQDVTSSAMPNTPTQPDNVIIGLSSVLVIIITMMAVATVMAVATMIWLGSRKKNRGMYICEHVSQSRVGISITGSQNEVGMPQSGMETSNPDLSESGVQVLPGITDHATLYRPRATVNEDCDSPSRPQAELQQLLEFSVAEPSQDGLQASETVADSENIGAIVSGNRLIEVQTAVQPIYYQNFARCTPNMAGMPMTKNPAYISIQPLQQEHKMSYQVRTMESCDDASSIVAHSDEPLRAKLGSYYSKECVPDHPLLASSNMQHVRLNLVQPQQRRPMAGRADEAVSVCLARGGVEQVPLSKEPIEYANILTFSPSPVLSRKRVLIEGVPGSGKSTLVQRMCHDWSVSGFAHDYELVIQVTLRSLPKDQKLSLEDLIYTTVADEAIVQGIVRYVLMHQGAGVLFVFDGFDEMSEEMRQKSIICDMLDGRIAPLSSFLITTRPISAESLYACIDRRVEICGFGDEEVKDYITKYTSFNPAAGKKLLSILSTRPNIKRLCYVPLLLTMICFLTAHGGDTQGIPPTTHQLYVDIIIHTVNYNLKREGKKERAGSLEDVMKLCPSFAKLADLALKGIGTDTIIFGNLNFEVDDALLGLVNCIQSQTRFGTTTRTWHFLHRTLQEFMAGLAMATKPSEEQILFWRKQLNPGYDKWGHFVLGDDISKSMFLFYCGVSGLSNPGIQSMLLDTLDTAVEPTISGYTPLAELCEVVSESGNEEYAHSIISVCGTTVDIPRSSLQGAGWVVAQYCKRVEGVRLSIGRGFAVIPFSGFSSIFSQLESVCSLAAVHLHDVNIRTPPSPVDLENVKQFLLKQKCLKSFTLTVRIASDTQSNTVEETLISLWQDVILHHKTTLEKVAIGSSRGAIPLALLVPALVVCQKLTILELQEAKLSHENMLTSLEELPKLQELVLEDVSVEDINNSKAVHDFELNLTKRVQDHPSLKALTIRGDYRSMPLVKGAVAGMSKRGSVEKLAVTPYGEHFTDEMVSQVALMMKTGFLKVLKIGGITCSQCMSLLKELPHCTCLQTLGVTLPWQLREKAPVGEPVSSCTAALLKAMSQCVSLEEAVLEECSFDGIDDAVEKFAEHLKDSKLTKLMMNCCELSPLQIATLCRGLHWNKSLKELNIECVSSQGNDVSDPDTLQAVEVAVRENTPLRSMVIWGSRIPWNNVAVAILKGATINATLRGLHLVIPDEPLPPQQLIDDIRRSNSKLRLIVMAGGPYDFL